MTRAWIVLAAAAMACDSGSREILGGGNTQGSLDGSVSVDGADLPDAASDRPDASVDVPDASVSKDAGTTGPCAVDNGGCAATATCSVHNDHVLCQCPQGSSGDGFTCTPIPPCELDNGGCDPHATCTQHGSAVGCTCNPGFTGNGVTCSPVDPCAANSGICDVNANCTVVSGTARCTCKTGYQGDGFACYVTGSTDHSVGAQCHDASGHSISGACTNGLACFVDSTGQATDQCSAHCTADSECGLNGSSQNICANGICFRGCKTSDPGGSCFRNGWVCYPSMLYSGKAGCEVDCRQQNAAWCAYGQHCSSTTGACEPSPCSAQGTCSNGQKCWHDGNVSACVDDCRLAPSSCESDRVCDNTTGTCKPPTIVHEYDDCSSSEVACATGLTCVTGASGAPSVCMKGCAVDLDCPGSELCVAGDGTGPVFCGAACSSSASCRSHTTCQFPVAGLIFVCQP